MDGLNDGRLLEAWRAGDVHAGEQLFARHFELVFRYFDRRVGADADELTQRTFLGLVEARDRFLGACPVRAYLIAIARKQLLSWFESRRRNDIVSFRTMSMADLAEGPSTLVLADERRLAIHAALRRLPIDLQTAVELYYFEELPIREIAVALDAPEGTIKRWPWRARHLLTDLLGATLREPVDPPASGPVRT